MTRNLLFVFCGVLAFSDWNAAKVNAQVASAQIHVAAARAAAYEPGQDFTLIYELCAEPKPSARSAPPVEQLSDRLLAQKAQPAAPGSVRRIPPRSEWYTDPQKVFDNVYYVGGNREDNQAVWAITTSEGIILIGAALDYTVEELVANGLKKMGLDPAQIKYVLLTAGKPEIYGGAKFLQDRYKARVLLSEADWDVIARSNYPTELKPKKDMIVTDGQKLTLGDVTVNLYLTPGHTPGAVSILISPLKDGNERHVGSVVAGRGPGYQGDGVQYFPTEVEGIKAWSASTKRFKEISEKANADVFLSLHHSWDKVLDKLNALKFRKPGGPHALVSKTATGRYLTVLSECMDAQLAWRSSE